MGNLHRPQRETIESLIHWETAGQTSPPPRIWPQEEPNECWRYFLTDGRELVLLGISEPSGFRPLRRERVAVFAVPHDKGRRSKLMSRHDVETCHYAMILYDGEEAATRTDGSWRCQLVLLEPQEVRHDGVIFKETDWSASYNPIIGA